MKRRLFRWVLTLTALSGCMYEGCTATAQGAHASTLALMSGTSFVAGGILGMSFIFWLANGLIRVKP